MPTQTAVLGSDHHYPEEAPARAPMDEEATETSLNASRAASPPTAA